MKPASLSIWLLPLAIILGCPSKPGPTSPGAGSPSPTRTLSNTPTLADTSTATPTRTLSVTAMPTFTTTPSATWTASSSSTATLTASWTSTATPTRTASATSTATSTATWSDTHTSTPSRTASSTPTIANTSTATATLGPTGCSEGSLTLPPNVPVTLSGSVSDFAPLCNGWVAVGNRGISQVQLINVLSGSMTTLAALSAAPGAVRYDSAYGYLYLTLDNMSVLARVDVASGAVSEISLSYPASMLAIGNGGTVFVSSTGYPVTLSVVNGPGGVVTGMVNVGTTQPTQGGAMGYDRVRDDLFVGVTSVAPSNMVRFHYSTGPVTLIPQEGIAPSGFGDEIAVSPDGGHLAFICSAGNDGFYNVWDHNPSSLSVTFGQWAVGAFPRSGDFSPDSSRFAVSDRTTLRVFSASTHGSLLTAAFPSSSIRKVRYSLGGRFVYTLYQPATSGILSWRVSP